MASVDVNAKHLHDRAARLQALALAVRRRRRDLGLHQDELADLARCSTRFVHALEAGKPTIQLDKLLDVLEVLGLHFALRRGTRPGVVDAAARPGDGGVDRE